VAQGDFVQVRQWAAVFRERFPNSAPEASLADIESGLAEDILLYHQSRLRAAHRLFAEVSTARAAIRTSRDARSTSWRSPCSAWARAEAVGQMGGVPFRFSRRRRCGVGEV
jgi:hypothetical protein